MRAGAVETLTWFARTPGILQTVLTGNLRANAELKMRTFGLAELIDFDIGGTGLVKSATMCGTSGLLIVWWVAGHGPMARCMTWQPGPPAFSPPRGCYQAAVSSWRCLTVSAGAVTFLAAARIGAVAVLTNPALRPAEHAALVADSAPGFITGTDELADRFDARQWIAVEELLAAARAASPARALLVGDGETLYIQYTSGITGQPKGAVHRHGDLAWHQRAVGRDMLRIRPDDVSLSVSKLYFAYGFGNSLIYPLHTGSSAVLLPAAPAPELGRRARRARRNQVARLLCSSRRYGRCANLANVEAQLISLASTGSPSTSVRRHGRHPAPTTASRTTRSSRGGSTMMPSPACARSGGIRPRAGPRIHGEVT